MTVGSVGGWDWSLLVGVAVLSMLISAGMTRVAIAYAERRSLIDLPGKRRSHSAPTPRGGGIGIVLAIALLAISFPTAVDSFEAVALRLFAVLGLAAISWLDDHRPLGVGVRLGVQALGCAAVAWTMLPEGALAHPAGWAIATGSVLFLLLAINLNNFMDGINGIATLQALFVLGLLGAIAWAHSAPDLTLWCTVPAAACLGFLPFNFPRARIFLGDVGSTVLGLWIGYVSLEGARRGAFSFGTALIASSAFALDAGATLGTRMLRGKRWWRAHREHLYQWLHRAGFSHSRVVALYLAWNLLVALPAALLNERIRGMVDASPGAPARLYSWALPVLALALGLTAWAYGKRWCRMRVQGRV